MSSMIALAPSNSRSRWRSKNAGWPARTRSPSHTPSPSTNPASNTDTMARSRGTSSPFTQTRMCSLRSSSSKSCVPWATARTLWPAKLDIPGPLVDTVGAKALEEGMMGAVRWAVLIAVCSFVVAGCGGGGGGGSATTSSSGVLAGLKPHPGKRGGSVTLLSSTDVDYLDPGHTYYTVGYTVLYATPRPLH